MAEFHVEHFGCRAARADGEAVGSQLRSAGLDEGHPAAADVVVDGDLARLRQQRYQGWSGELGKKITSGALNLASLADLATEKGFDPAPRSGRQELAENIIARHCKY